MCRPGEKAHPIRTPSACLRLGLAKRSNGPSAFMGACSFEAFWKLQARVGQLDSGMVMQDITKSPPPRLAQPRISQLEAVPSSMQEHDANICWICAIEPFAYRCDRGGRLFTIKGRRTLGLDGLGSSRWHDRSRLLPKYRLLFFFTRIFLISHWGPQVCSY